MHELATSPARRPVAERRAGGSVGQVAFEQRHGGVRDQLSVRLGSAPRRATPRSSRRWGTRRSRRSRPGIPPHVSIGGYNLGVSAYSKHPDLAFEAIQCLTQQQNQSRDAVKGGLAPVAASIYDDPGVRQGVSVPRADQAAARRPTASARRRRPTPTSRSRSRRRCRRPRHQPEHGGQHACAARSSCRCPRRRCCERRHRHHRAPRRDRRAAQQHLSERARAERRLAALLVAPGGDRDDRGHRVSDHRRGRAVAPARRPAVPERHQVGRPVQLRPRAERAGVVAGRVAHGDHHRDRASRSSSCSGCAWRW